MLFYTGIFLASLVSVLVPYLIYKAVFLSCKAVASASEKRGSSDKRFTHASKASGNLNCGIGERAVTGPLTTAGANSHVTAWHLAKTHPVVDKVDNSKKPVWPPREAIGASVGKHTKVRRYEGGPKKLTLDMVSKPFKREVALKTKTSETASKRFKGK